MTQEIPDPILALRPADPSSAASIAEALERADLLLTEVDEEAVASQEARDDALLDAFPAELVTRERKLTAARAAATHMRERVITVKRKLEVRLADAKRADALFSVEAAREAVEGAGTAFVQAWETAKEDVEAALHRVRDADALWDSAYANWQRATRAAKSAYPDLETPQPAPTRNAASDWRLEVEMMTRPIPPVIVFPPDPDAAAREELRRNSTAEYVARLPYVLDKQGAHG